ncbi:hypothetical protein BC830DRAFT_1157073, partial [Chytriomyces sp. MP71]
MPQTCIHWPWRMRCIFPSESKPTFIVRFAPPSTNLTLPTRKQSTADCVYISMLLPLLIPLSAVESSSEMHTLPRLFSGHQALLRQTTTLTPSELETLQRPDAHLEECSIFLLPNNTVLSIFQQGGRAVTDKILEILHGAPPLPCTQTPQPLQLILSTLQESADPTRLTALRRAEDAGLVLHALADGIVDTYFSIIELYETQIARTQDLVLTRPRSAYVK